MKKYLSGLVAAAIAMTAFAFTSDKSTNEVFFSFIGNTASSSEVRDAAMWEEAPLDALCDGINVACQIAVAEADVSGSPGSRTLASHTNVQLDATQGGITGHFRPTQVSGSAISIQNKD